MAPSDLEARARRAYELGRLRWALRLAPFVLAVAALAIACGRPVGLTCGLACALLPLAVGLAYAGGSSGRAVVPGLLAGSVALALPLLVRTVGVAFIGPGCMVLCLPSCVLGGALAGGAIAVRTAREETELPFLLSALAIAGLTGALGCTMAGLAGVAGMVAGALSVATPVLLAARR